jgi:hypothetical protein
MAVLGIMGGLTGCWQGSILVTGAVMERIESFGSVVDNSEDVIRLGPGAQVIFDTRTSRDFDG